MDELTRLILVVATARTDVELRKADRLDTDEALKTYGLLLAEIRSFGVPETDKAKLGLRVVDAIRAHVDAFHDAAVFTVEPESF